MPGPTPKPSPRNLMAPLRQPALYVGTVGHERSRPIRNRFRYGLYFLLLDVDRITETAGSLRLLSHNRPGLISHHDSDHGPRDGSPLRPWIDGVLAEAGIDLAGGQVMLLTFPRVLGGRFFPVAFWYCFHGDGTLRAVLAEVNNTFHEHHSYLLHEAGSVLAWNHTVHATKVFHVSPFIPMDARYEFEFSEPVERLTLGLRDIVQGELLLTARVALERRPLTDGRLLASVLRHGPMSSRAWVLIRWQAIKLLRRGLAYLRRPPLPPEETTW